MKSHLCGTIEWGLLIFIIGDGMVYHGVSQIKTSESYHVSNENTSINLVYTPIIQHGDGKFPTSLDDVPMNTPASHV